MVRSLATLFFILLGISFTATPAAAQTLGNQSDPLRFIITPEIPKPGDVVVIEAQGVGNFLGDANIIWQVNGKTQLSGLGERKLVFIAGSLGSQTRVHVEIDSPSRGVINRDLTFNPSLVHLVWEADTSVPPWYKGKAAYSAGSTLKVVALPRVISGGAAISSSNLSFRWKHNGTAVVDQSGKGRSSISFTGNQLLPGESVSVDVQLGDVTVGHSDIYIPVSKPYIMLYARDPLRGTLYDRAMLGSVSLGAKEITVQAEPYFFSKSSLLAGSLPYTWELNGNTTTGPDSAKGILTLRQAGSGAGSAALKVTLQNSDSDKLIQSAENTIRILFGSTNTASSLFGI